MANQKSVTHAKGSLGKNSPVMVQSTNVQNLSLNIFQTQDHDSSF
jgi:hypothetical protein